MTTFTAFEEIGAWKEARALTGEIYGISKAGPFSRDFAFRDQIRRASVSIVANIAEGFERNGTAGPKVQPAKFGLSSTLRWTKTI